MKLFTFCLLLPLALVATAPIRAQRENVLSFLIDSLGTSTQKTMPANITANPPSKPVKEEDSDDTSEAQSTERFGTNGLTDASRGLDSDEIMISKVLEKPSRRNTNVGPLVQDQGSREHGGPQGAHPASVERTDLNSEQTVDAQEAEHVSGEQVLRWSRSPVTGSLHGLKGMPATGRSRELMDRDSLEDNGRPAPVDTRGGTDYDETREFIRSETHPIAPQEHTPGSFSAPAKSRASR